MPDLNLGDLAISSPAFAPGDPIPDRFSAGGANLSPALRFTNVPDGAEELVLVVHDPDAPLVDGFTHWVVAGIDPGCGGLDEQATEGFSVGRNSAGEAEYMGPAPPTGHGIHHYFFHLYALDQPSGLDEDATREEVLAAIEGHIIEQARLVGTFESS